MRRKIGTARPDEPADALEACKFGAWAGDRLRAATPLPVAQWPEQGPPRARRWDRWRVAKEAA